MLLQNKNWHLALLLLRVSHINYIPQLGRSGALCPEMNNNYNKNQSHPVLFTFLFGCWLPNKNIFICDFSNVNIWREIMIFVNIIIWENSCVINMNWEAILMILCFLSFKQVCFWKQVYFLKNYLTSQFLTAMLSCKFFCECFAISYTETFLNIFLFLLGSLPMIYTFLLCVWFILLTFPGSFPSFPSSKLLSFLLLHDPELNVATSVKV